MFSTIVKSTLAATVITGGLFTALPALADVENPNILISASELKAKCKRSGGDWKVEDNGVYRCVVHNDDSTTVVECEDGECDGFIFDSERRVQRKRLMVNRVGGIIRAVNKAPRRTNR